MQRFKNELVVVTGAARGIGYAIARRFAQEGAKVACVDISATRIQASTLALSSEGFEVRPYVADVGVRDQVRGLFDQLEVDFGSPCSVVVNNAAWIRYQPIEDIDEETLDRMWSVGLKAIIWTLDAALPQLKKSVALRQSASVVNICSTAAFRATADSLAYCAVKAGVAGVTRAAAVDLGRLDIRVNAVAPAFIPTQAAQKNFDQVAVERRRQSTPMGRLGTPEEIASAVTFLASTEAGFINGEVITVDGGRANSAL